MLQTVLNQADRAIDRGLRMFKIFLLTGIYEPGLQLKETGADQSLVNDFISVNPDLRSFLVGSYALTYHLRKNSALGQDRPIGDVDILTNSETFNIPEGWSLLSELQSRKRFIHLNQQIDIMSFQNEFGQEITYNNLPIIDQTSLPLSRALYDFVRAKEIFDLFLLKKAGLLSEKHLGYTEFSSYVFSRILETAL